MPPRRPDVGACGAIAMGGLSFTADYAFEAGAGPLLTPGVGDLEAPIRFAQSLELRRPDGSVLRVAAAALEMPPPPDPEPARPPAWGGGGGPGRDGSAGRGGREPGVSAARHEAPPCRVRERTTRAARAAQASRIAPRRSYRARIRRSPSTRLAVRSTTPPNRPRPAAGRLDPSRRRTDRAEVTSRPDGRTGFHPLPKRWVVERTFAGLIRSRRLVRDVERLPETSAAMVQLSGIRRMARRARPPRGRRTFRYKPKAAP